jgi:hypothetical protein
MTVNEMQYNFTILAGTIDRVIVPTDDIIAHLNLAQDEFLTNELKVTEGNEMNTSNIYSLMKELSIPSVVNNKVPLSSFLDGVYHDYRYLLGVKVVTASGCPPIFGLKEIRNDQLPFILYDSWWKPKRALRVLYLKNNKNIEFYTEAGDGVVSATFSYVKRPRRLVIDTTKIPFVNEIYTEVCELPLHTHTSVVELAVELYLKKFGAQKS